MTMQISGHEAFQDNLSQHGASRSTSFGHEKTAIQRQIDRLVYALYGLTDKEIRIVEEATK